MLETMKKHNLTLKDQFWAEEKAIATLKSEILGLNDVCRHKSKSLQEAQNTLQQLKHVLSGKQTELQIEKDNENTILKH